MCTYSKVKCGYSVYNPSLLAVIGIGCVCVGGGREKYSTWDQKGFSLQQSAEQRTIQVCLV